MKYELGSSPGITFWILALLIVVSAFSSVAINKLKTSLISLFVCLFAVSGLYALMDAWFVFYMHLLLHTTVLGVMIYMLYKVTTESSEPYQPLTNRNRLVSATIAIGFALICAILVFKTRVWRYAENSLSDENMYSVSNYLTTEFLFPFVIITASIIASKIFAMQFLGHDKKSSKGN